MYQNHCRFIFFFKLYAITSSFKKVYPQTMVLKKNMVVELPGVVQ